MDDQTGFTGSQPAVVAGAAADDREATSPPTPENRILVKEEPLDEPAPTVVVAATGGTPLPPLSEEQWRAYYHQPNLVLVNEEGGTIYETYKLPSLHKFGKELMGKLPAIWGVAVASQEGELITADSAHQEQSAIYLHRDKAQSIAGQPIIIQQDREDSVIHAVHSVQEMASKEDKEMIPLDIVVKKDMSDDVDMVEQRELQTQTSPCDKLGTLEGTTYSSQDFSPSYEQLGSGQYSVLTNVVVTSGPPPQYGTQTTATPGVYALTAGDYYRELNTMTPTTQFQTADPQYIQAVRQHFAAYPDTVDNNVYVERFVRQCKNGTSADLPSPDSGIGGDCCAPRESIHQIFDYGELEPGQTLIQPTDDDSSTSRSTPAPSPARKNSWNQEFGRNAELDKVQIPKLFSDVGFHYYLESPISTSQRREDDRMTYINKGQYYGITLEYINDPERTLRSATVKSTVMLVFREEKSMEDELKAWKFWHSRQHSSKQRILDADTKNSCGLVGQIEEVTHNAISFYWNPLEGPAKISVSVHCLSTDFSNQKGVKGFPLHIQVDTTDDIREGALPIHRGYAQIKVFCDKGAERKTRDEERRAAKRKIAAAGSNLKKIEVMYHQAIERSEFYSMSDLSKPPILFTPDDDSEKTGGPDFTIYSLPQASTILPEEEPVPVVEIKPPLEIIQPPIKKFKHLPQERLLLYVKQASNEAYQPLHVIPKSLQGLTKAVENRYNVTPDRLGHIFKRNKKGATVVIDDEMVKHYLDEDSFTVEIKDENNKFNVTLVQD